MTDTQALRDKLAKLETMSGGREWYAQMDRYDLCLASPDQVVGRFACGEAAAFTALPAIAGLLNALPALLDEVEGLRAALRKIEMRSAQHPDDGPEDDKRDKYHCHAIARAALGGRDE